MRRLAAGLSVGVGIAGIGLSACYPGAFIASDGTGYGVWVTNESEGPLLVAFEPHPGDALTWDVPSGTIDGRGPWISFDVDQSAGETGEIILYAQDCDVLGSFEVEAGEYRLGIRSDGTVTLSPEDVLNDAGGPLAPASKTC
jgi:hypothetical protein